MSSAPYAYPSSCLRFFELMFWKYFASKPVPRSTTQRTSQVGGSDAALRPGKERRGWKGWGRRRGRGKRTDTIPSTAWRNVEPVRSPRSIVSRQARSSSLLSLHEAERATQRKGDVSYLNKVGGYGREWVGRETDRQEVGCRIVPARNFLQFAVHIGVVGVPVMRSIIQSKGQRSFSQDRPSHKTLRRSVVRERRKKEEETHLAKSLPASSFSFLALASFSPR